MNEKRPYEHLIAEKLQQLPVPDVNASWQEMKRLLDEDRSPDGAGGKKRLRPGRGRWWGAGIIAAVLITGTWLLLEQRSAPDHSLASAKQNAAVHSTDATGNKSAPEKSTASTATASDNQKNKAPEQTSTLNDNTEPASSANQPAHPGGQPDNAPAAGRNGNPPGDISGDNPVSGAEKSPSSNNAGSLPIVANSKSARDYSEPHPDSHAKNKKKSFVKPGNTASNRARRNIPLPIATAKKTPGNKPGGNDKVNGSTRDKGSIARNNRPTGNNHAAGHNRLAGNTVAPRTANTLPPAQQSTPADDLLLAQQHERHQRLQQLKQSLPPGEVNSSLAAGNPVDAQRDTSTLLNDATKTQMAKSKRAYDIRQAIAKKEKKSFHLNLDLSMNPLSLKADGDPWWGAGLSFNAAMPTGGQSRYKYNVNGKTSLLTDYLPSPYVEFHLNQYVYLQTEINLSAPQYTPELLLYHQPTVYNSSMTGSQVQQSIYVEKLYYFNWPVSIHYSPYDNFYLTTGLQFSSFQSGLARIDSKRLGSTPALDTMESSRLVKFKDDTIAAKLRPNEWRWQLGAEYYWNRFTVGVRYNRAFTDLVHLDPGTGLQTKSRNAAFLFYLRFNLFEGRKKDNSQSVIPSFARY